MRTITKTIKLFEFDELSSAAQRKALDSMWEGYEYPWHAENRQSLESFCDAFGIKTKKWEYGAYSVPCCDIDSSHDSDWLELGGKRAYATLYNLYSRACLERKTYKIGDKERRSKISFFVKDCPFSGFCIDENLLDPLRAYLKKPDFSLTVGEVLQKCLTSWAKACQEDTEYFYSDECMIEKIKANKFEFTDGGLLQIKEGWGDYYY